MCIIFWSQTVESYALVLAANRDEFLHRPTTPAAWHAFALPVSAHSTSPSDTHRTLSGLDLEAGGTWLGISLPPSPTAPRLRFGTITNYTEMIVPSDRPTRGNLVKDFLVGDASLDSYLAEVERTKEAYAGYNLLLGELDASGGFRMGYASNREKEGAKARVLPVVREAAVVGLSNATLGGPGMREEEWPKVQSGCAAFEAATLRAAEEEQLVEGLWSVLSTANPVPISHRSFLRHTVLVRPTFLDPTAPFPATHPPFPSPASFPDSPAPYDLPPPGELQREGTNGGHWYATRVQTVLLVERESEGRVRVVMRERDAYVLDEETGKPRWSGEERRFELGV